MTREAKANSAIPAADERREPYLSAASPPRMMKTAAHTRYALTAHSAVAASRPRLLEIAGSAAIIAVLFSPTASIATHEALSTSRRWSGIVLSPEPALTVRRRGRRKSSPIAD